VDSNSGEQPVVDESESPAASSAVAVGATKRSGRPRGEQAAVRQRTRERLLQGALRAVASRGLAKFAMSDVSEFAGVSRGTAYRYFSNTEELLAELGRREAERFEQQVWESIEKIPTTSAGRLRLILDSIDRIARDHPLIQRLPETDPGFVLTAVRERFPDIRETFQRLLVPQLEGSDLMRRSGVSAEQLASWMARMMISMYLFPEPDQRESAKSMRTVYEMLFQSLGDTEPKPAEGQLQADGETSSVETPDEESRTS
jgi:AcrR family transcriptional regulator